MVARLCVLLLAFLLGASGDFCVLPVPSEYSPVAARDSIGARIVRLYLIGVQVGVIKVRINPSRQRALESTPVKLIVYRIGHTQNMYWNGS